MKMCRDVNTFPQLFSVKTPTMYTLKREYGYDFTQAYIEAWIVNLRDFINVGKSMTDQQTFETAILILDTFPSLTVADIHFVFKRAKIGYYGKQYDRLDGQVILSWFAQHFDERCDAAEAESIRKGQEVKEQRGFNPVTDRFTEKENYNRLLEKEVFKLQNRLEVEKKRNNEFK